MNATIVDFTGFYKKLENVFEATGGKVVVNSAFKLRNNPYLIWTTEAFAQTREHILF